MKFQSALALGATASTAVLAAVVPQQGTLGTHKSHNGQEKYLVELAPQDTRWVTEEEKWSLRLVSDGFFLVAVGSRSS